MTIILDAVVDLLIIKLRLSIPIILCALSATIAERSGVICLGVEGMMLIGAFFGVLGSYLGGPWIGVLLAIVSGAAIGLIYGVFGVLLHGNQTVVGLAVNIFAGGFTPLLCNIFWGTEGVSETVATLPNLTIPGIKNIPYVGKLFAEFSPFLPFTLVLIIVLHTVLYKTKYGLRLRAIGDYPLAVQTQGINTNLYKLVAMGLSGIVAALGGAYLSISFSNVFIADMIAGRGFMGVAANIFGGWTPLGSCLASLFFAAVHSIRYYLIGTSISTHLVQMIPYVVTLFALVFFGRKSQSPEGLGQTVE